MLRAFPSIKVYSFMINNILSSYISMRPWLVQFETAELISLTASVRALEVA